jgi:hypothetical protein
MCSITLGIIDGKFEIEGLWANRIAVGCKKLCGMNS